MTSPAYKVTVTITDGPQGRPIITSSIEPPPNPKHRSPAVIVWLAMKQAITPFLTPPKKGKK